MSEPDRDRVPPAPGTTNERTVFAWLRSGLALLGAALVLARMAAVQRTPVGLGLSAVAVVLAAWVVSAARRRYARATTALREGRPPPDGRLIAAMSALVTVLGAAATVIVVTR